MAALLGADLPLAEEIAAEAADGEVCGLANDNAVGQVVLSGAKAAIDRAVALAAEKGVKKAVLLPVSAPFHCALMTPAADIMATALAATDLNPPAVPVFANVSAAAVREPGEVRDLLERQVTAMVRWRESVLAMASDGVEQLVEIGAGNVLKTLTRRIDRQLEAITVGTVEEADDFLRAL